jgi:hypothetical protein
MLQNWTGWDFTEGGYSIDNESKSLTLIPGAIGIYPSENYALPQEEIKTFEIKFKTGKDIGQNGSVFKGVTMGENNKIIYNHFVIYRNKVIINSNGYYNCKEFTRYLNPEDE